ncbi:response regulator transcription factor [Parasalinivibrio latis]|uniref:LuxR C-terminal-related transcriptional regulator n=1 Tax=Parasalinivibrio latis TaxID=2952610 RepID=UPI0030E04CBE
MVTVTLVEDDDETRERLSEVISGHPDFDLLDASATMKSGVQALLTFKPDVLLVDLGLPDGSGVDVISQIYANKLDTQAVVVSGFHDEHLVFDALEAGAQGYILKHDRSQNIADAIQLMLSGGSPISPLIARMLLQRFNRPVVENVLPEALTARQEKILHYVSQGFSSKDIAEKLKISYHTVTTHIKNIYGKLQVNSRTEAIFEAKRLGLIR